MEQDQKLMCPPSSQSSSSGKLNEAERQAAEFEVWQDEMCVAMTTADDRDRAWREALHYAAQYRQDGPVEIYEVTRQLVFRDLAQPENTAKRSAATDVNPLIPNDSKEGDRV